MGIDKCCLKEMLSFLENEHRYLCEGREYFIEYVYKPDLIRPGIGSKCVMEDEKYLEDVEQRLENYVTIIDKIRNDKFESDIVDFLERESKILANSINKSNNFINIIKERGGEADSRSINRLARMGQRLEKFRHHMELIENMIGGA